VAEAAGGGGIFFAFFFGLPPKKGLNLAPRPFEGRARGWGEISEKLTDTRRLPFPKETCVFDPIFGKMKA